MSFPKIEDTVAVDLVQNLKKLCQVQGVQSFDFLLRLSNVDKQRWDEKFIGDCIKKYQPISRLWVIGPHVMTEQYEKLFEKNGESWGLSRDVYEVI